jgi:mono/diheme cytochrome c family protein
VRLAVVVSTACAAVLVLTVTSCGTGGYSTDGSQGVGKQLFLDANCGACHTLADAGTVGTIGPNLDDAFAQARESGMTSDTFTQVVRDQTLFPITETSTGSPGMPGPDETLPVCSDGTDTGAFCVADQHQAATDIGVYIGAVAGTGIVAKPPPGGQADGKSVFTANCGGCHMLADAGTSGTVGPNLDAAKPPKALVVDRVTNGKGVMPPFKDSLDAAQIQAVADYVASAAGR